MMLAPPVGKDSLDAQGEVEEVTDVAGIARKDPRLGKLCDEMRAASRSWQARLPSNGRHCALSRGTVPNQCDLLSTIASL